MDRVQNPGMDYTEMADFLGLRTNTLRQHVKRGKIPTPDFAEGRDLKWSVPKIVEMIDAGVFDDNVIAPPHWREYDPENPAQFSGVVSTESGHPVITFKHAGITVGIAPGRFDGPRLSVAPFPRGAVKNVPVCDFIYAEQGGPTGIVTLLRTLASAAADRWTIPRVRGAGVGQASQDEDNDYQKVWARLSAALGVKLPYWPDRLLRLEDVWAWNPSRTEARPVLPLPQSEGRYNALSAIEPFVDDEYRDFIGGRRSQEITNGLSLDLETYVSPKYKEYVSEPAKPSITSSEIDESDDWPSSFDEVTLRKGSPFHMSAILNSAEFLTESDRKVPYRVSLADSPNGPNFGSPDRMRLSRTGLALTMLNSPKRPDPDFGRTLLGIAAGGEEYEWSVLDGSDARVAESDGEIIFVPPTRIAGMGRIVWISVPEMDMDNYPIICDEYGRAWPMPINPRGVHGAYVSGYSGGSPADFASAVTLCLSHNGELESSQIVASKAMKAVIPEIGHSAGSAVSSVFRRSSRTLGEALTREELVSMLIGAM